MNWQEKFKEGQELVLATCSQDSQPHANIVVSLGFIDDKLLIADCQMNMTLQNLRATKVICVVSGYWRLKGRAEVLSEGKYFDLVVQKAKDHKVKNVIIVDVEEVFDLDKMEVVK